MCPAEKCVPGGGAREPRPTGQVRYPPVGDGVRGAPTARQRRGNPSPFHKSIRQNHNNSPPSFVHLSKM